MAGSSRFTAKWGWLNRGLSYFSLSIEYLCVKLSGICTIRLKKIDLDADGVDSHNPGSLVMNRTVM
ncbi:hypothetical protein [Planctomycetes bacterium CA13]|uniref:hypothetical protein n=1 Tax=Novipirellula herctigrandis TaxID=2527986 RepID=UPI0011B72539